MRPTRAWRSTGGSTRPERVTIERRALRDDDVAVRIDYCGVCHTDLHAVRSGDTVVPGHEFVGEVTEVGSSVVRFSAGDPVAVGTIVDSCGACAMCARGLEQCCHEVPLLTYGGTDADGRTTEGGYSREYVLRESFAYPLPTSLEPSAAAPLMCAGITVWSPLRAAGVGPGSRVAVAGLGGLGHLAVKLAAALGADVTVLSRTADKERDVAGLGASGLLLTTDDEQMAAARDGFDVVIDTIPVPHDPGPLLRLAAVDGLVAVVGYLGPMEVQAMDLLMGRKRLTSSGVGGTVATAELLEFCAEHGITADVEVLPSSRVGEALERLGRGDVRYRFVLDLADLDD